MNIRHGDMALIEVEALPEGLLASDSKILLTGSGGNPHTVQNGTFYPHINGRVVGYLAAHEGCMLLHPDHGSKMPADTLGQADVSAGIYKIHNQVEQTHEGMRPVED